MSFLLFITHPEVTIDPAVPVRDWSLSKRGLERMHMFCDHPFAKRIAKVFSSAEKKARDGAEVLAERLNLIASVDAALGENDRSSTGYLPRNEFIDVARQFFASPEQSIRGWERAADAQQRIVAAVRSIADRCRGENIAVVSHGGVGTLLMCHLRGQPISLSLKPPDPDGGCYFAVDALTFDLIQDWSEVENSAPSLDS